MKRNGRLKAAISLSESSSVSIGALRVAASLERSVKRG